MPGALNPLPIITVRPGNLFIVMSPQSSPYHYGTAGRSLYCHVTAAGLWALCIHDRRASVPSSSEELLHGISHALDHVTGRIGSLPSEGAGPLGYPLDAHVQDLRHGRGQPP